MTTFFPDGSKNQGVLLVLTYKVHKQNLARYIYKTKNRCKTQDTEQGFTTITAYILILYPTFLSLHQKQQRTKNKDRTYL